MLLASVINHFKVIKEIKDTLDFGLNQKYPS